MDGIERTLRRNLEDVSRLRALAGDRATITLRAEQVSSWSVGQQLEHVLISDRGVLDRIERILEGTLDERRGSPRVAGLLILALGFIPRGRGKAPSSTRPDEMAGEEVAEGLDGVAGRFEALLDRRAELATARATWEHPLLGHFTAAQWLRFLHVHHRHHEKIVRRIVRVARELPDQIS